MSDDRPAQGEPQDDMAVTDRQWTYHVVSHWTRSEAQRLVIISRQAAELTQFREQGGDDGEASD